MRAAIAAVPLAALAASSAHAADRYYVNPASGIWNLPANWSATPAGAGGASVPVNGDSAFLLNTSASTHSVTLGAFAYSSPGLNLLAIDGSLAQEQLLQFDSAGAMFAVNQEVGIDGLGLYNHGAGSNTLGNTLFIGKNAGSQGNYILSGSASLNLSAITFQGPLLVGNAGTGELKLTNTSAVNIAGGNVGIGVQSTGVGTVRHDGGSFTMTNVGGSPSMFIGRNAGSTGSYLMTELAGTSTLSLTGGNLYAGYQGTGSVVQSAGSVQVNATTTLNGSVYIASEAGSTGSYTINGGSLSSNELLVGGGSGASGGTGTFTSGGGTTTVATTLRVWKTGAMTLNAGTVSVGVDTTVEGPGGKLVVNGGTLNTLGTPTGLGLTVGTGSTMDINGGAVNTGRFIVDGTVTNNGGAVHVNTYMGSLTGAGVYKQIAGSTTFANGTNLQTGSYELNGGTFFGETLLIGQTAGTVTGNSTYNVTGGTANIGVLGLGNNGTITGGAGSGTLNVSGGTLYADTILEGSTVGGSGDMTISDTGEVTVGGGWSTNSVTVSGSGKLTVLDQNPPAGEDPVLNRAIVGGYLRDGAMYVNGGTVSTPNLKVGVTPGKVGTYEQNGGVVTVSNALTAPSGLGFSVMNLNAGTLNVNNATIDTGAVLSIGNISNFTLNLLGGTVSLAQGGILTGNATLSGEGTIVGNLQNAGDIAPGNSPGIIDITGDLTNTGSLSFEIASASSFDELNVTGAFDAGGVINVTALYGPALGTTFDLMDFGSFVNSGYTFNFTNSSASQWDTSAFGSTGSITFVPEPGMIGLIGMGAIALMRRRRHG